MTKSEWEAACQRLLTRLDNLKIDDIAAPRQKKRSKPSERQRIAPSKKEAKES